MRMLYLGIRSLVLWTISLVHFFVVCTFLVVLGIFKDPRQNDRPQRWFFRNVLRVAGVRFRVRYSPGFDPSRTAIFVCNHVNIFDPMVIYSAIPQFVRGIELESHFKIPAYGWMVSRFGNIPVPARKGKSELRELSRRLKAALDDGISIIVFAEGHRTHDGRVAPFQKGIFRMARDFGYPIAPMSITGAYEWKSRHSWLLKPATVEVYLHDLVETSAIKREGVDELVERVHAIISKPIDESLGLRAGCEDLKTYRVVASRTQVSEDLAGTSN